MLGALVSHTSCDIVIVRVVTKVVYASLRVFLGSEQITDTNAR